MGDNPKQIDFHYIKAPAYTTYHADGAIGARTPRKLIHISFYSERIAIPQKVTHAVEESGRLGAEISTEGKSGIIREVECGVSMDIHTAKALKEFLEKLIKEHQENP